MPRFLLALAAMLILQTFEMTLAARQAGKRIKLFDGVSLKGWSGNPAFWSVKDGAIHGVTNETRGELLLTDGDFGDFRLILKSRLADPLGRVDCRVQGHRNGNRSE